MAAGQDDSFERIQERADELLRSAPLELLRTAGSVVELECPDHIANVCVEIMTTGLAILSASLVDQGVGGATVRVTHARFMAEVARFTHLARAHLNGEFSGA